MPENEHRENEGIIVGAVEKREKVGAAGCRSELGVWDRVEMVGGWGKKAGVGEWGAEDEFANGSWSSQGFSVIEVV